MQTPTTGPPFTNFDYGLILIVLFSTFFAFSRGLIKSALSLVGLIVGIVVASWEYLAFAMILNRWITEFGIAEVVAFLIILALVLVLFDVVARMLKTAVKAVGLGLLDRLLGGAFGAARGVVFGAVAVMAIVAFEPGTRWTENSQLAPYFLAGFHEVSFIVPQHFQDQIASGANFLVHETPDLMRSRTKTQQQ